MRKLVDLDKFPVALCPSGSADGEGCPGSAGSAPESAPDGAWEVLRAASAVGSSGMDARCRRVLERDLYRDPIPG